MVDKFNDEFYKRVEERIATTTIGASTIQKMGTEGMLAIIHDYLATIS